MGDQRVRSKSEGEQRRRFMRQVLADVRALEQLVSDGLIETGKRRIGAEQEVFLIDRTARPAPAALDLLDRADDNRFTTELGLFNLEMNLDPLTFGGKCLGKLERDLTGMVGKLRALAAQIDVRPVLTGILPTLRKSDLGLDNMTPKPRYHALNRAMSELRGGAYELHIKGIDEMMLRHDSVMLEACNASFQIHFQTDAEEFPGLYNIAQVVAAPVLAAAANSPLLFGRRLWRETRIALFQQSVDTRSSMDFLRERSPRVTFGEDWVHHVVDLYQEDIARFRTLVTDEINTDSLGELARGEIPRLRALCLHNSTVYRWNRACYGITDGKPHLRLENRVLPSGPTVIDEVANAAFWFGLIAGMRARYDDVTKHIEFSDAKMNFGSAARLGLGAQFHWLNGETRPAIELICDKLIPLAREGLSRSGIADDDADRYLAIIDRRVSTGRNGAEWITRSLAGLRGQGNVSERLNALTSAMADREAEGRPVSEWEPAQLAESGGWKHNFVKVEQYMTTDLFTVGKDESLDLVASLMQWKRIRHVPVEDRDHRLVGLVSYRSLLRLMASGEIEEAGRRRICVADIMNEAPITIGPGAGTLDAIHVMRQNRISCLPVVKGDRLVGIITERDLVNVAAELLEEQLREP